MGILEGLKRTLNIAGAKIIVALENNKISQSDLIKGGVVVTAPEYRLSGSSIKIELQEFYTDKEERQKLWIPGQRDTPAILEVTINKTHAEVGLLGAFDFEPKSEHRFPFEVRVPRNCRISTANTKTGWQLAVTMDIPKAKDPEIKVLLKIQPAKAFLAIVKVCEEKLGFQLKSTNWYSRTSRTYFHLSPLEALRPELDSLQVGMGQEEGGDVEGVLTFNLKEKSIGDYFKAFMGKDLIKRNFRLAISQIFSNDGNVNRGEIAKVIGDAVREVTGQRPY